LPAAGCAAVFSDASLVQLGVQFGLPADSLRTLVTQTSQMWCVALSAAARSPQGATRLYDTVMSPDIDARAADHLIHAASATHDLVRLSAIGYALVTHVTDCDSQALGDIVSTQAGVPAQAAYAFAGLVAFALFSTLKRYELIEQGNVAHLQRALVQPPDAVPSDAFAQALGWADSHALADALQNAAVLPLPAPANVGRQTQEATPTTSRPSKHRRIRRALPAMAVITGVAALAAWIALDPGQWPPAWLRSTAFTPVRLAPTAKAPSATRQGAASLASGSLVAVPTPPVSIASVVTVTVPASGATVAVPAIAPLPNSSVAAMPASSASSAPVPATARASAPVPALKTGVSN